MKIESSWDDGSKFDFRIANLLYKYNIPGTFYVPTVSRLKEIQVEKLYCMGFEIGGHTVNHPTNMRFLEDSDLSYEIEANKDWIEQILQKRIEKFCYPRGRFDDRVINAIREAGFKQGRTTLVGYTEEQTNPFRYNTTVHVFDYRKEYHGCGWLHYAIDKYEEAKEKGYFHIWGHGWEIEKYNQWENLEKFFKYVNEN